MREKNNFFLIFPCLCCMLAGITLNGCASWGAASAEEYFSIGMAYFDMGKFDEAEKWLNRAKAKDKTKSASEYNLGRIAFETKRYADAAKHFEAVLKRDGGNVLALKAAAYTRIKTGEIAKAEAHYRTLLELVPESADDGYNYALVLYAMEKYSEAEQVLKNHEFALLDNNDVLLLYARTQKAQDKVEAIDSYAKYLVNNSDAKVRYEYAQLLEGQELYARALEEYRSVLSALAQDSTEPKKSDLRFTIARLLLIADSESKDGLAELEGAVSDGFADFEAVEKLLADERIGAANRDSIKTIITEGRRAAEAAAKADEAAEAEAAALEAGAGEPAPALETAPAANGGGQETQSP
jgi:tetratricopeptide (TPR) repeat protein